MRVVSLSELYKYDFYLKNLDILHAIPKIEVENYQYKNIPTGHFVYGSRGTAEYFDKNTKIKIFPQTLAYIPTGVTVNFKEDEEYEYYKIYFNLYDSETNEELIFSENPIIFLDKTTTEITNQIYELTTIYAVNHEVGKIKIISLLYSLFLFKPAFFFSDLRDCHKWRPENTANCERGMLGLICCLSGGFNQTEERIPGQGREMSLCFLHVLSVHSSYIPHSLDFTTYLSHFTSETYPIPLVYLSHSSVLVLDI